MFIGSGKGSGDVLNLTVNGNVRELIKGDYVLEVEGNYTQKIGKNLRRKVGYVGGGNCEEEIKGNHSFSIDENVKGRVAKDVDVVIGGNEIRSVSGISALAVEGFININSTDDIYITADTNLALSTTSGIMSFKSGDKLNMKSASDMTIKTEANMNMTTSGIKKEVVTGAAHETFSSTYYVDYQGANHFTHSGVHWYMRGDDYYARHEAGVNYACNTDPVRSSTNDCTDLTLPTSP